MLEQLSGRVAIVTGAAQGIGWHYARGLAGQGAKVVVADVLDPAPGAERIRDAVQRAVVVPHCCDVSEEEQAATLVSSTVERFGRLDVLVNNAAVQFIRTSITDIPEEQLENTFRTNIFGYFYFVKAALPHLAEGGAIINVTSVTAFRGSPGLLDYSSTKGAILAFTRSLAQNKEILDKKIRVNAVAPGPIWTPLIPASFSADDVAEFGADVPLGRAGQPEEVAPALVFLASVADSSYITGQTIHVNGGEVVGA
jgi:NAD(P)-dependent dehydrogenase (short-subunit alcohol dehydrogenase family)